MAVYTKMHLPQPDGLQALIITIFDTWVLGLGMTILVNVAAILSCPYAAKR